MNAKLNYKAGYIPTKYELEVGAFAYNVPDGILYTKTIADTIEVISSSSFGGRTVEGVLDWNDISNTRSGAGPTLLKGNALNGFHASSHYYHVMNFEYRERDGSGNCTQIAIPYVASAASFIHYRSRYGKTWEPWYKVTATVVP